MKTIVMVLVAFLLTLVREMIGLIMPIILRGL